MNHSNLIPYNKTHSISEVAINFYLSTPILDPKRFKELQHNSFKEFTVFAEKAVKQVQFNLSDLNSATSTISNKEPEIIGFRFDKNVEGIMTWVVQLNNQEDGNGLSVLSFHCLDPDYDWDTFFPEVKRLATLLAEFDSKISIKAVGLNYIDQFNWIGEGYPDLSSIFRNKSKYLPSLIFRDNSDFSYSLNVKSEKQEPYIFLENFNVFSRTISIENINIGLTHLIVADLGNPMSIFDFLASPIESSLTWAHDQNKLFLKETLHAEICNIINLS